MESAPRLLCARAGLSLVCCWLVAAATGYAQVGQVYEDSPGEMRSPSSSNVANSTNILSTGFEAEDGWDLDFSICGEEFAATCPPTGGFPNACVPKNHAASMNCCQFDPNEDTGWSMSPSSQHCREPSIRDIHPFAGQQHLRFQYDPDYGNPPGCSGFTSSCRQRAITAHEGNHGVSRATWSFEIAISDVLGSNMIVVIGNQADTGAYFFGYLYWQYLGVLSAYDFLNDSFVFAGYWSDHSPDYANHTVVYDPCSDVITYSYAGVVYLQQAYGFTPPFGDPGDPFPGTADIAFFTTDHHGETIDIDDHHVTREPCPDSCCDGAIGECLEGLTRSQCIARNNYATFHENVSCEMFGHPSPGWPVSCDRTQIGACCAGPLVLPDRDPKEHVQTAFFRKTARPSSSTGLRGAPVPKSSKASAPAIIRANGVLPGG